MKHPSLCAAAALTMALATGVAKADTITNTFTFATLQGYNSESGPSFAQFNPSLGTLNSVTYQLSATANFAGGRSQDYNEANYQFKFDGTGPYYLTLSPSRYGDGSAPASEQYEDASVSTYVGTGMVHTSVDVYVEYEPIAQLTSTFGTETLTYNYTPVTPPTAVTPEPSSIVLLGTGLLGAAATLRRRFVS